MIGCLDICIMNSCTGAPIKAVMSVYVILIKCLLAGGYEKWKNESVHLQFQCIHVMLLKKEFPMGHRFECEDISFAFMLMVSSVLIMMGLLG